MVKKGVMLTAILTTIIIGFVSDVWCQEETSAIGKGSISLGGDLDLSVAMLTSEDKKITGQDYDTDSFGLNIGMGYFIIDNLELGISLRFESGKTDYDIDGKYSSEQTMLNVGPFLYYHLPLTDNLFLIFGGGGGLSTINDKITDNGQDEFGPYKSSNEKKGSGIYYGVNLGVEHFLTDSVAIIGNLAYLKIDVDGDVTTSNDFGTPETDKTKFDQSSSQSGVSLGVRVYF